MGVGGICVGVLVGLRVALDAEPCWVAVAGVTSGVTDLVNKEQAIVMIERGIRNFLFIAAPSITSDPNK